MKRWIVLLLLVAIGPAPARAQTLPPALWQQAVAAAAEGDYRKSAERFAALHEQGYGGAALLYDLGTCYQHLGDKGRARAFLEQAHRLDPWDRDTAINLARLRATLDDSEPEPSALSTLAEQFPTPFLAVAFTLLQLCFWLTLWRHRRTRRELHFWLTLSLLGLWLMSGVLLWTRIAAPATAAILPESVQLKNGPGREATDSVVLHAGTLVRKLSQQGDWVEVEALGRVRAWVREDDLVVARG